MVTAYIHDNLIDKTLFDLGFSINMMARMTMGHLLITNIRLTHIVLELINQSKVIPTRII